jgi:hypothetical protein
MWRKPITLLYILFFVRKSCLDYHSEVSHAAETFAVLDEHVIYYKNYLIVVLVAVQSQQG